MDALISPMPSCLAQCCAAVMCVRLPSVCVFVCACWDSCWWFRNCQLVPRVRVRVSGLVCMGPRYMFYSTSVSVASSGNVSLEAEVSCANAFSVFIDGEVAATNFDTAHSRCVLSAQRWR